MRPICVVATVPIKKYSLQWKNEGAGLPFGYSACYHSKNVEEVCSKEYIDFLVNKGALFAWYFTYMPVGKDAVPELIANADQRKKPMS